MPRLLPCPYGWKGCEAAQALLLHLTTVHREACAALHEPQSRNSQTTVQSLQIPTELRPWWYPCLGRGHRSLALMELSRCG